MKSNEDSGSNNLSQPDSKKINCFLIHFWVHRNIKNDDDVKSLGCIEIVFSEKKYND